MNENLVTSIFCKKCGVSLPQDSKFCYNCGSEVDRQVCLTDTVETIAEEITVKKKREKSFVMDLFKRSLILAVAILMIVATFLPFVTTDFEYLGAENLKIKFSAIDGIDMMFNSFGSLDEEDLQDELESVLDEYEGYADDWADGEEQGELSRYLKKIVKVSLRLENIHTSWELAFIGVFSFSQIIVAIALLVFAALSFASLFTDSIKAFQSSPFILLGINGIIMLANGYAYKLMFGGKPTVTRLTAVQISTVASLALIFLIFIGIRIFVEKNKVKVGEMVKRSLSLVFAVVLLCSCLAPVVSTEIKTTFSNRDDETRITAKIDPSLFGEFYIDENTKENLEKSKESDIDTAIKSTYSTFSTYTKREVERGEANDINKSVFAGSLLHYGLYDYCSLYAAGSAAMILVFVCALIMLWKNLYEFAIGARISSAVSIFAKVFSIIMSVFILVLLVVACHIVKYNVHMLDIVYKVRVAYGPILMLISAVAVSCVPDVRKNYKKCQPNAKIVYSDESENTNISVL